MLRRGTDYAVLSLCLMSSSSLSNIALNYITLPTKVIFRSCKLIPTMVIAVFIHKKTFSAPEWTAAAAVCLGLVLIGFADYDTEQARRMADAASLESSQEVAGALGGRSGSGRTLAEGEGSLWNGSNTVAGLVLVSMSVIADAVLPNIQQRLFQRGESRADVIFISNLLVTVCMFLSLGASGDLMGTVLLASTDTVAAGYMVTYGTVAYVAVSFHMAVVQNFGGVQGVLVGNSRKAMTIVISFLLFPKPVTVKYVLGAALSLTGLTCSVIIKERRRGAPGRGLAHATAGGCAAS